MRGRAVAVSLVALTLGLAGAGCAQEEGESTTTGEASTEVAAVSGPAPVAPPSGDEICASLRPAQVEEAIGTPVTGIQPQAGPPGCSYVYVLDGTTFNSIVAIMRPDKDLGGRTGRAGVEHVLELNRAFSDGAPESDLEVAAGGVLIEGSSLRLAIVDLGGPVMTVTASTNALDAEAVRRLTGAAAEALA